MALRELRIRVDRVGAQALARRWWAAIRSTSFTAVTTAEGVRLLQGLIEEMDAAVAAGDEPSVEAGRRAGGTVAGIKLTDPMALIATAHVLARLPGLAGLDRDVAVARSALLVGAFGQGFATAQRERIMQGQNAIQQAMGNAQRHVLDAVRQRLYLQARLDPLTGLANRLLVTERLAELAAAVDRLGVCLLDLDNFKTINDGHGHPVGDTVLRIVADRLRAAVRDGDLVGRLGGDEFVVLIGPPTDELAVAGVAARLRAAFDAPITVGGNAFAVSASIGITVGPAAADPGRLLQAADAQMYRAKATARVPPPPAAQPTRRRATR